MRGEVYGSYRVLGSLGKGGMASVYLAEHIDAGHRVAIKVLRPELRGRSAATERFLGEVRAISRLDHPGIVRLHDYGHQGGAAYFVMDFLRGESLSRRLEDGALDPATAASFAREIAQALAHAHLHDIVHRDLKPANVFLVSDPSSGLGERAVVLDFGIAKQLVADSVVGAGDGITKVGVMVGTPEYMSPEQCRDGRSVDHRTDVYSLGVLLFRMLTGELPFDSEDTAVLLADHQHRGPAPPSTLQPRLAGAFDDIVLRCLAKDPADRYPSMLSLATALMPLTGGARARRRPATRMTRELLPLPPPRESSHDSEPSVTEPTTAEITEADELPEVGAGLPVSSPALVDLAAARPRRGRRWRWGAAAAVAGGLVLVAIGGGGEGGEAPASAASEEPERSTVAIEAPSPLSPAPVADEPAPAEDSPTPVADEPAPAPPRDARSEPAERREAGVDARSEEAAVTAVEIEMAPDVIEPARERDRPSASSRPRMRRSQAAEPTQRRKRREPRKKSFEEVETPALF